MTRMQPRWVAALGTAVALLFAAPSVQAQQTDERDDGQQDRAAQQEQEREDRDDERLPDRQPRQPREPRDFNDERDPDERRIDEREQPPREIDRRDEFAPRERAPERQRGVMLGVMLQPSPTTGVLVVDVQPGGPAAQAGLRRGDYILSIDGQRIHDQQQLEQMLSQMQVGARADMTIWRNEEEQRLAVNFTAPMQQEAFRQPQTFQRPERREQQAWLGVILSEEPEAEEEGVEVLRIYPTGPAARAGLEQGDVIKQVGETRVRSAEDLINAIDRMRPGQETELTVLRDDEEETLEVRLGNRADFIDEQDFPQDEQFQQFQDLDGDDMPEHLMMLEHHRHLAQQHQRLENLLLELRDEVQSLRRELQGVTGRAPQRDAEFRRAPERQPGLPQPPRDGARDRQPAFPEPPRDQQNRGLQNRGPQ